MYEFAAKKLPKKIVKSYNTALMNAGFERSQGFVGFILVFGLGVAFTIAFVLFSVLKLNLLRFFLYFIVNFILIEVVIYMWLVLKGDSRGKQVDAILPDALRLMAMHLKSGLTIDRALINSARPEFGPLEERISRAGKQVLAGKDVKVAFLEIPHKIKSELLERTVQLIVEGVQSGGELSHLLEETAEDIHDTSIIQKEIKATVLTYAIFIFFAAAFGAPMIFGISTYIVESLTERAAEFQLEAGTAMQANTGFINVSASSGVEPSFLILYAVISLIVTSVSSSLIIGMIKDGNEKQGVKYIPLMIALSIIVFFGTRFFVSNTFAF
jgi:flagellar protein FlaJ